jgi:hypothetical protein
VLADQGKGPDKRINAAGPSCENKQCEYYQIVAVYAIKSLAADLPSAATPLIFQQKNTRIAALPLFVSARGRP